MANPRKFSEKIALQKQRQQEGTAEFERIMKEVYATKMDDTQANQKILECCLVNTDIDSNHTTNASLVSGSGVGGGGGGGNGGAGDGSTNGPAVNTAGSGSGGASPDSTSIGSGGGTSSNNVRESRGRSVGVGPMRRPSERKQDRSPYGSNAGVAVGMGAVLNNNAYLSPPMDSSWRRSNSDSALHQTLSMAVAAEGGFGPGGIAGVGGLPGDMNVLHANYQHHNQRSHSPNIGRSFSPQAQRRKGQMMHHHQQHPQQHLHHSQQHLQLQQQHQQLQQHFQQQQQQQQQHQQHMHQQAQQQHVQQHHPQQHAQQPASSVSQQQQHPQHFNAKYTNCNMPINNIFKSLQEQSLALANTGSLPDLTSLHYSPAQQQLIHQQQQPQHQQQTLSPILSPHNNGRDRDQSSSPFSPAAGNGNGGGGGGGPPSPYQQQQHSPTSAANTPTAAQTSPHLSFTNLAVQSPTGNGPATQNAAQSGNFTNLPTLGAASSTGNLTDYRQPLNPPSPGSSPGLLTSVSGNDVVHISAPASPIRHPQAGVIGQGIQGYNEKNIQTFDRYSPAIPVGALEATGYNSLNPSFHNHFEQFTLGDSNSSPEQQQQLQQHFQRQQQQQNSFTTLDFDDFVSGGNGSPYSQSLTQNKQLDFGDLAGVSTSTATTVTHSSRSDDSNCNSNSGNSTTNNNNTQQQQLQATRIMTNQLLNNNGTGGGNNVNSNTNTNGPCRISNNNVNLTQANEVNSSPIPSPLGCLPSPSSPLPIPINTQSPHHQQHQHMTLSLHSHSAQPSPHHSPLHSPHHASPLSSSSPGITTLTGGVSPSSHGGGNGGNNASSHHHQHQPTTQHQQHHHHQQNHANTPTNTNIPAIIFSDYSSREIFDSLDLDLGQMDETALDLLADQNSIMIADATIEDSFRKDLN
ncbi:uncharacterized protein DDB_G0283357 [Anastrepha ludens]|uniref:uncharacterized protein DDB_G0283357 n=1 Tax=Anastrepha ludens TaxID=28586 RepID=UPI0023B0E9E8|nr:uncharacterized protein DDB_G0283357 [Anastrepha ludens]